MSVVHTSLTASESLKPTYLTRSERAIVNSDLVYSPLKLVRHYLPTANPKTIVFRVDVADYTGATEGMDQTSISISLDCAVVVGRGYMRPLIEWRDIARVNELPAGIAVGKPPLDPAVGKPGKRILTFFNDNDATNRGI